MSKALFWAACFSATTAALASETLGFKNGNKLDTVYFVGQFSLECMQGGQRSTRLLNCSQEEIFPDSFDNFVYPDPVDADQVQLSTTHADGKQRVQTQKYDPKHGMSRAFDLWAPTLFQHPLLDYGTQPIHYVFLKNKQPVSSGDFTAQVNQLPGRSCPYNRYTSTDLWVCKTATHDELCSLYFETEKWCQ